MRADALASTTSRPAFVTTRDRPSCRNRTGAVRPLIWCVGELECCPSCQSAASRRAIGTSIACIFRRLTPTVSCRGPAYFIPSKVRRAASDVVGPVRGFATQHVGQFFKARACRHLRRDHCRLCPLRVGVDIRYQEVRHWRTGRSARTRGWSQANAEHSSQVAPLRLTASACWNRCRSGRRPEKQCRRPAALYEILFSRFPRGKCQYCTAVPWPSIGTPRGTSSNPPLEIGRAHV